MTGLGALVPDGAGAGELGVTGVIRTHATLVALATHAATLAAVMNRRALKRMEDVIAFVLSGETEGVCATGL